MTALSELTVQGVGVIDPDGSVPDDGDGGFLPNFYIRVEWGVDHPNTQYYREGSPKAYARGGLILTEKDDCPELVFRSYTRVLGVVKRILGGTVLGRIYANSPNPSQTVETQGWYGPNGDNNRTVQIDLRENDDGSGEIVGNLRKANFGNAVEAFRWHAQESTGSNTPLSIMKNGAGGAVRRRVKFARVQDLPSNAQVLYVDP